MNRISIILLLVCIAFSCKGQQTNNRKKKQHNIEVAATNSNSITPQNYVKLLGKGIDATWCETPRGIASYNSRMVKDFKDAGLSHIRIRVKEYPDAKLLSHIDNVVKDCIDNNLIPIIAYQGGDFEEVPTMNNLNKSVEWWTIVAEHFKNSTHKISFDLIIEVSDALNKEKEMLNTFYEKAVTAIRKTNPSRIIFISPVVRSAPEYLKDLKIPSQQNNFLMAEWHFYASGPDKVNEAKKWTTGTEAEKELIRAKIRIAKEWQAKTGIYTWVGAWMAGNYNKGNDYTPQEQVVFANFVTCELTKNNIPFAFNADQKYYDAQSNKWIKELKPVFDEIIKTNCGTVNGNSTSTKIITGLNQNWSYLPELDNSLLSKIEQLKPQILRYPGGTVSHRWNWKKGEIETRKQIIKHPITDIKKLVDATGAKFTFVVDIVNKTIEDQIEMLQNIERLGVPIEYIELGNELYAKEDNYETVFPTGADYANKVKIWYSRLKTTFPNAKITALLLGRSVKEINTRQFHWNNLVVANTIDFIDAYTYHIYINENDNFEATKNNFKRVAKEANTGNKPLWITEYGNKHVSSKANYLQELSKLADFIESFPNVSIAMSHQIVGSEKNKITKDGTAFTPEGNMFLKRINKK